MKLAKPHLDVGLFTDRLQPHLDFWGTQACLEFDHRIDIRSDWTQHRFKTHGSIVKVNHLADGLPQVPPTGYAGISIASERPSPWEGPDPDGTRIRLLPRNTGEVTGIGITVRTPNRDRMMAFYIGAMEFDRVDHYAARCGDTMLFVEPGPAVTETEDLVGSGFRYLTIQIFDADREMAGIISRGGRLARDAVNLGDVARFGFVKDPDGNWIEVSARNSLIGDQSEPR